eukprot:TRINITY_DN14928_c0_g1_i3.p1 TRINITY_DN14928_c0_g1~~TRINITY_DN14928_c0_g1_i3.p1  ORF type:complete len:407 (+),score=79.78 TRINITY_DN14928_c0_g1_i3:72-1292(+)
MEAHVHASWNFRKAKSQAGTAATERASPKWLRCLAESPLMLDATCRSCFGELGVSPSRHIDELTCKRMCQQICLRLKLADDSFDAALHRAFSCSRDAPESRLQHLSYPDLFALIRTCVLVRSQATPARAKAKTLHHTAPKSPATEKRPLRSILVRTEPARRFDERRDLRVQVPAESAEQGTDADIAAVSEEQALADPGPVDPRPVRVRILSLSGSLTGSTDVDASSTVRDVVQGFIDCQGAPGRSRDESLQGGAVPVLFADDEPLYRLDAPIGSLPVVATRGLQDVPCTPTIDFRVIWKQLLRVKDRVKVVHDLQVTIMYVPKVLPPGQMGQVLTINGSQAAKQKRFAPCKLGYALIHFEGIGNGWVSRADQCKLVQISDESEVQEEAPASAATESYRDDAELPSC